MRFAFANGKGFLGHKNHAVAMSDGRVVGIAASYDLSTYRRLTVEHLGQLWMFYPTLSYAGLIVRAHHLKSVMPPPDQDMHYVANFGVELAMRGRGIGSRLLDYERSLGMALRRTTFSLDVSVENPRAQALYERYGFRVSFENRFTGPMGAVPNSRRMTMSL